MDAQPIRHGMTQFEIEQQRLSDQNRGAVLTMWTGLAAILSLLLTCLLGSFWRSESRTTFSVSFMVLLLIVSVILFFTLSKRDERWYVVCSVINHAGIGLAVLILLDVLGLEIRFRQLVMSGLPAAAILFGVVMIYVGMEEQSRKKLLYVGTALFGLALLAGLYQFYTQRTEFWLCTAVCALLSCVNLCALIWTSAVPEERSIYRTLAVASFAVYLILAIAAIAAFALAILSGSNRDSKSTKKLFSWRKHKNSAGNSSLSSSLGSGATGSSASVLSGLGTGYRTRRRTYLPSYFWYYGLYHGNSRSRSAYNASDALSEEERMAEDSRLRRRRRIVFCAVAVVVILVIVLAVVFGRG